MYMYNRFHIFLEMIGNPDFTSLDWKELMQPVIQDEEVGLAGFRGAVESRPAVMKVSCLDYVILLSLYIKDNFDNILSPVLSYLIFDGEKVEVY